MAMELDGIDSRCERFPYARRQRWIHDV